MALCDLSQFNIKDLHQALINYIKKNLEEVANNPESRFDLDGLVRNVYDRVYNTDQNSTKSLGIAQHVPSAIITVINNNIELRNALEPKGLDFKVLYKNESEYSKGLEAVTKTVDRPKDIKKYINVYEEEEETLDATPTVDLENPNIYYILKSFSLKEPIEFNTTTFREVLLDKNNNYTSKKDPQRAFIFNTLKNILNRLQESGESNASNITIDGQTGFRLMMFDSNEEDIKANLIPGTFNPRSTYIWAITDNDGNIIKFDNDGNVDLEDGKMVYYYVREKSNKKFITQAVDKRRDQLNTLYKNEANKNEVIDKELEAFEKEVTEFRKKQEEDTRQLIQQLNAGKRVMANITGGKTGFYDTTPTRFIDILPTLTKEEINSISIAKVTGIAGAPFINIDGVDEAIEMRAVKKLTANDSVLVSIGQVLTYKGNDISNEEKIKYFKKFIYPQPRTINDPVPGVSIALNEDGSLYFQVRNKVFDLQTAQPEEIANALQGSYLHIDSQLLNAKSYTKYTVKNDRLIQSQENYLDLIKDSLMIYARPNKLSNGEYDKIVATNGYFIWEPTVETNDGVVKGMVDENTKAVDDTDDNAWEIKFDMNKVIREFGTPGQDRRAREWTETSNLFKIKDKNGNPVVPLNLLFNVVNSDAWATFSNSGVTLYKGSNYTHAYHEAWHAFSQLFLTKEQKRKLYDETSKLQGEFEVPVRMINGDGTTSFELKKVRFDEATPRQLEEYIAEEFRKYAISRGEMEVKQKERKNIFKRIWEALKALFTGVRISEVVNEPETIQHLKESFDNLYVGRLNTYMPSINNIMFSKLRAGIVNVKDEIEEGVPDEDKLAKEIFTSTESKAITESMDGIISKYMISKSINKDSARALDDQGRLVNSFKDKAALSELYKVVLDQFIKRVKFLDGQIEKTEDLERKNLLITNRNLIQRAINNYGGLNESLSGNQETGVIAYHMRNSTFKDQIARAEDDNIEENLSNSQRVFNRKNYVNLEEEADIMTLFLIRSLIEQTKNSKGEYVDVYNDLGFPKLANYKSNLNFLIKNLSGERRFKNMYNKIKELSTSYPIYKQLLSRLGDPSDPNMSDLELNMWAKFLQDFNKPTIKIFQNLVEYVPNEESGEWVVKIGRTATGDDKVLRDWSTGFELRIPSKEDPYIKYDTVNNVRTTVLNLDRVFQEFIVDTGEGKFRYKLKDKTNIFKFLNAIGINLTDNQLIRKAIDNLNLYEDINYITNEIGEAYASKPQSQLQNPLKNFKSVLSDRFKTLANIEANLSDKYNSLMRMAPGERPMYEQNLNSTATQITDGLNSPVDFKDMMSNDEFKHMRFLSPTGKKGYASKNPWTNSSILLNSLFDMTSANGNRRKYNRKDNVKIDIVNLGGTEILNINEYVGDGLPHSDMSRADKFLTDFYSVMKAGLFEQPRHGGKSSFFGTRVSKIYTYDSKGNDNLFVDHQKFITYNKEDQQDYEGFRIMTPFLMKYLNSDLIRIYKYEKDREIYDKIAGFENYGNFSTFDKVLSDEIKNRLKSDEVKDLVLQYGSLTNIFNNQLLLDLETSIKKEMKNYFDNLISRINNNVFQEYKDGIVDDVYTGIKQASPNATKEQLEQAAIRSFVYNTWFNNVEMMILYYGDPLQYKVQEDEFHKRIGTMFATGKVMPTDVVSQAWAARMGRPYFDKMVKSNPNFKPNELAKQKRYNGTMNTAVLDDSKPSSIYLSIFEDLFRREYKAEGKSDKDINIALYGKNGIKNGKPTGGLMKPFYDMKEGDGQGWISFDSYRMLKKLEGDWSEDIQEPLYKKIVEGEYVSTKQMMEVFPVYKLLYSGPLAMEGDLLPMTAIHKFSLFPLTPNAIKTTGLEKLHMKMMEQGVDYTLYKSGSKLTTVTNNNNRRSDVAFVDGNTNDFNDDVEFTINPIYTAYLKDQLKLGNDFKENARFSTQLRALLPYGLFEGGIPVDYKGKREWKKLNNDQKRKASKFYTLVDNFRTRVNKLINYEKDSLLKEIGWTTDKNGKPIGDEKSLVEFVQKEMREQGFSEHDINYLDYDEDMNMIYNTISIDTSLQSDRIERMLLAIINNRIIRQKIKGTPFVEVSGAFANRTDTKFFKPTKEDYKKYKFSYPDAVKNYDEYVQELLKTVGTSGLPFYLPILGTATKAMKVKIALQGDYVNMFKLKHPDGELIEVTKEEEYTEDGKRKTKYILDEEASLKRLNQAIKDENWLNTGEHRKMITLTGVRIPVQYLNSMEFAEVYEFLPPDAGPIIILPAEIVAKSGTDFDVDKLTMYTAHITRTGKYVKDIYSNPDEIMDEIDNVLDQLDAATKKLTGKLYDSKKLIKKIREDIKEKRALDSQKFQMLLADRDLLRAKLDVIMSTKVLKDLNLEKNRRNISKRLYKAIFEIQNTRDVYNVLSDTKKLENKRNYNLLSKSGKAELEKASKLVEQIDAIYNIINESSKAYKTDLEKTEIQIEEIRNLNNRYQDLYYQYNNFKSGIENGLIEDIRAILELPENAYRLLKPNDVHLTKVVAEELEEKVQDYDYRINGRRSPTTLLEYDFNLKKHQDNIIAGESLGITAKGNKFNQYSTEGNNYVPEKTKIFYNVKVKGKTVRKSMDVDSEIFLKSNVEYRADKDGLVKKFISLAKLYNTKMKGKKLVKDNEIGEIFNQLISGFVDAEKDPWVAFIQGNKQTVPLLLNLLEAGVEFRQAVLFVSNPLVRKYVRYQQESNGVFNQIRHGEKIKFPKYEAKRAILNSIDYDKLNIYAPLTETEKETLALQDALLNSFERVIRADKQYEVMKNLKEDILADTDGVFTDNDLESMLETNPDLVSEDVYRKQFLGLLHFMFVDSMFDGNNQLKQIADPDTKKQSSLFDNQVRKNKLKKLKDDGLVAPEQIDFMTKDSVIKGFFLEDFALDLFGPLFKLTNNEVFNNFLEKQISDFQNRLAIEEYTGMDVETYTKRFRKDFTLFILTNYINNFNPGKSGFYKGIRLKEQAVPVKYAEGFNTSAFVKEEKDGPVLYIDPALIRNEFLNKDFTKTRKLEGSSYDVNSLSFVNDGYFTTEKEYYNFVAEREYLRYLNPITKLIKEPAYQKLLAEFKKLRPIAEGQAIEEYEQSSIKMTYEVYIKNLALDNIWNHTKLFDSGLETYAAQLDGYIKKYPFLTKKFKVLDQFLIRGKNERGTIRQSDSLYLTLRDATTMDGETASEYHDELVRLSTEPVLLGDTDIIKAENKILNDFFKRISVFAFLQSGMNTGAYSITKIVPTEGYKSILEEAINEIGKIDDRILSIYNKRLLQRYEVNNRRSSYLPFNYITDLEQELIKQKEYGLELYPKNSLGQQIKTRFVKPTATENVFILEDEIIARDKTTGANIGTKDILFEIPISEIDKRKNKKDYRPRTNLEILIDTLGPEYHVVLDDTMQRRLFTNKFDILKEQVLLKEKFGRPLPAEISKYVVYQNKVSGVESHGSTVTAKDEIIKQLGPNPTSFQMIKAGLRKRTTRSAEQMQKLGDIAVGDILVQRESGSDEYILTKVTGIYYKGEPGYEGTWGLEGWRDEDVKAIRRLSSEKGRPAAITFEKVREDAVLGLRTYKSQGTGDIRTLSPLNLTDENIQLGKQYLEEDINAIKNLYKQGKKILFLSRGYGQVYAEDVAAEVTQPAKQSLPSNVQVVSPDYGVVKAETNPTESEEKADVELIKSHIQNQSFKENVGQYANEMFHYGLRWGRKNYNFYVLKDNKYVKSTLQDLGSQLYSRTRDGKFVKSNRKDKAAYNNGLLNPLDIDSFAGKTDMYGYDLVDQNGNLLPSIKELQPIIDKIEAAIGIDMKDYDSVIGNIYLPGEYVYPHKDTSESKTARNYPVIVYSIGNDAGLGIVDNNKGKMTFANQYDAKWLPDNEKLKGYTNEITTKHGTVYTFGMDGKGRFELTHSTPINSRKDKNKTPITLPNGKVVTNYTITLTFRRAADLTPGMPKTPTKLPTKAPVSSTGKVGFDITEEAKGSKGYVKDPKKARIATDIIEYGRDTATRKSRTKKYGEAAVRQGIPRNSGNYNKNTVAMVSVSGSNAATQEDINNTVNRIIEVLRAGGSIVMDNKTERESDWNKSGEGEVFKRFVGIIGLENLKNISKDADYVQIRLKDVVTESQPIPATVNQANYKEDFFVYLSKRLAQEFKYVNPKSENKPSMSDILSTMRPITKEEIEDAKRNCTTL